MAELGAPSYVTERCVFALKPQGLELIEVAPGIDIERDILEQKVPRKKPSILLEQRNAQ